jgi:DNA-binding response OmpR family regulator
MSRPATEIADGSPRRESLHVLVYSENPAVRERVRFAVGRRPAPGLSQVSYVDTDTGEATVAAVDAGGIDLCILDGESWPTGGMGVSRQLKNEVANCPAIVLLVGRRDDAWLAKWSQADAVLEHPLDPVATAAVVARLLTERAGRLPTPRPR